MIISTSFKDKLNVPTQLISAFNFLKFWNKLYCEEQSPDIKKILNTLPLKTIVRTSLELVWICHRDGDPLNKTKRGIVGACVEQDDECQYNQGPVHL